MSDVVHGSNGKPIPISDLPITYGYTGLNLTTQTVAYQGITYIKTFTYSGSNLTAESQWVAQ